MSLLPFNKPERFRVKTFSVKMGYRTNKFNFHRNQIFLTKPRRCGHERGSCPEGERYIQLNGKIQRIARRNKKAFLNEQYKEIEENNRMGKTRDLFNEIGDTKGTFHAKMGMMKDRNGQELTEAEIKKR